MQLLSGGHAQEWLADPKAQAGPIQALSLVRFRAKPEYTNPDWRWASNGVAPAAGSSCEELFVDNVVTPLAERGWLRVLYCGRALAAATPAPNGAWDLALLVEWHSPEALLSAGRSLGADPAASTLAAHSSAAVLEQQWLPFSRVGVANVQFDTMDDGRADTVFMDTTGDNRLDTMAIDTTGDGLPDTTVGLNDVRAFAARERRERKLAEDAANNSGAW